MLFFEVISLSSLSSKYSWKRLGELCCLYMIPQMMLLFCGSWISIQSDWKASSDTFSMTVYFSESLVYKPTPPEARGVGTYSKTYPGMLGLKSISLPLIVLVSETPIMLNSKFNSSNRWTWKFSRFRLRLLILLCKREKLESLTRLESSLLRGSLPKSVPLDFGLAKTFASYFYHQHYYPS